MPPHGRLPLSSPLLWFFAAAGNRLLLLSSSRGVRRWRREEETALVWCRRAVHDALALQHGNTEIVRGLQRTA